MASFAKEPPKTPETTETTKDDHFSRAKMKFGVAFRNSGIALHFDPSSHGHAHENAHLAGMSWHIEETDPREPRLPEWWDTYGEAYDGAWIIKQGRRARGPAQQAFCLGRLIALQTTMSCIRRRVRGEDAGEEIAVARAYLDALPLEEKESRALHRLLDTLSPFDPASTAEALVGLAWTARRRGLLLAARSCALFAYECAVRWDAPGAGAGACRALSDLARMEECPRAARRWRGRAHVLSLRHARVLHARAAQ